VPAAAVIPAPIRKTKVAVFKKLVVEFRVFVTSWSNMAMLVNRSSFVGLINNDLYRLLLITNTFTLRKLEC
jgi:hypothetical protein